MEPSFWWSVIIAIPLAIAGNFATSMVQSALNSWSKEAPTRKEKLLRRKLTRAKAAAKRPRRFMMRVVMLAFLQINILLMIVLLTIWGTTNDSWFFSPDTSFRDIVTHKWNRADFTPFVTFVALIVGGIVTIATLRVVDSTARAFMDSERVDELEAQYAKLVGSLSDQLAENR